MQYNEGHLFDGRYLLRSFIGSGSYGEVWLAFDQQTEVEVAVKVYIEMDSQGLSDFKKEFQVSFNLNHTNLLHANFLEVSKDDNRAYLVMPFCPQGSSSKYIGDITEDILWDFIHDVSAGLAYLHSQTPPIIHQDIKPDNILIARNGEFVITDFGISQQARSTLRRSSKHLSSAGSVAYMGPERFSKQYNSVKASDIWSLGVTIYELASGELPFCGMGGSMQKQGADIPDIPEKFSNEMNMIMQSCLAKDTWNRPTAAQLSEYASKRIKNENPEITWTLPEGFDEFASKTTVTSPDAVAKVASTELKTVALNKQNNNQNSTVAAGVQTSSPAAAVSEPETKSSQSWLSWVLSVVGGLAVGVILSFII
ncbi:MAG: serine/threonine-protein kinase [Bacteroidaceae bacterium]|nr:serine/threonine-protein kinase [Bacteroidaceae bacterium]